MLLFRNQFAETVAYYYNRRKSQTQTRREKNATGNTHLKKELLPTQPVLGDLAVLPAELLDASPFPVVLIKDVQCPDLKHFHGAPRLLYAVHSIFKSIALGYHRLCCSSES